MIYLISLVIALGAAGIEALSYPGIIASHLHIPAYFFYVISILLSLTYKNKLNKFVSIITIIGYVLAISYFVLIFGETITYPNFIFTTFHLNPATFQFFIALSWFHILIVRKSDFVRSLLIAILIFVGVDGAGRTFGIAFKDIKNIMSDPFATYEQKMAKAYPGFYPAMQEIKKLTPADSTILIPPQGNPWEMEGNAAMVTYFLYPRHVENLDVDRIGDLPRNKYLLIAKGSWPRVGDTDYGWPKVSVASKRIWHIDVINHVNNSYKRDYDPNLDKWDWGLIEV
jgi:hypothetical protein